jgi:TRAP-type uncharacterized transport system substrate-binding protein
MSLRLPRWLRLVLFVLALCLAIGLGLKAIQVASKPATLKLAVGSFDGEAVRVMTAIGSRMAATGAGVRITIVDKGSPTAAAEAFAAGEADLAVVRADSEELAHARTVVQLTNLILIIAVPANSPIKSVGDLKGKTVGVVGLESNRRLLATLAQNYGFAQGSVQFVDVPLDQLVEASRSKKHHAAIFAAPLAEKYIALVRSFFPAGAKIQARVLEIESAEAIALSTKYYESFDLPKGALRGAPPLPDDAISTLRVPLYLVAGEKVSADAVSALAKAIMDIRRELIADTPLLAQIAAPDDEKNAAIPIHPGAKTFFSGEEKTWSDKYGDWLFYGTLLLGMLGSFVAGLWKFLTGDDGKQTTDFAQRLSSLIERSRKASNESDIDQIDRETDELIGAYLKAHAAGQVDTDQSATLNLMIGHLQNAIDRRSRTIRERRAGGLARG